MPTTRQASARRAAPPLALATLIALGLAAQPAARAQLYQAIDLGVLGGSPQGFSVDNSGHVNVAGYSDTAAGYEHAFVYSAQTGIRDIGSLGGITSGGYGINAGGQVTGVSYIASNDYYHAFLYTPGGTGGPATNPAMADLGTFGGTNSYATALSSTGAVTGRSQTTGNAATHAFSAVLAGGGSVTMTDLGTLGGATSEGLGINAFGQIVGDSLTAASTTHAFLWEMNRMFDLNDMIGQASGWVLTEATGISDTGDGTFGGQTQAFELSAAQLAGAPEPSEWTALGFTGLGVGGLLWRAKKRRAVAA